MKKSIFILFVIISCVACNNDYSYETGSIQETEIKTESLNAVETINTLKKYNDSLCLNYPSAITRGVGNFWIVSAADGIAVCSTLPVLLKAGAKILTLTGGTGVHGVAFGVLLGTAFLSGGASYAAYRTICGGYSVFTGYQDYLSLMYNNSNHLLACNNFYTQVDSMATYNSDSLVVINDSAYYHVAAMHNEVLENALSSNNVIPNRGILPPLDPGIPISPTLNSYGCAMLTNIETEEALSSILDNMICLDSDFYTIFDQLDYNLENGDITSNINDVLSLFFSAYLSNQTTANDVNTIVSYYHNVVSNSTELSSEEKATILLCIEITRYSFSFWNELDSE